MAKDFEKFPFKKETFADFFPSKRKDFFKHLNRRDKNRL